MNNIEILEFLELPNNATDADIKRRALEKKSFFERLQETAPNAVLKNLHSKNLEKTLDILKNYGVVNNTAGHEQAGYNRPKDVPFSQPFKASSSGHKQEVGWLIRHTENQVTKSFPLFEGINILGRERHPQYPTIIFDTDVYVSRQHATVEVVTYPAPQVYIKDGVNKPSKNGVYLNANDTPIQTKLKLNNQDTIQIGMTKLILKMNGNKHIREMERDVEEADYMKTIIINI